MRDAFGGEFMIRLFLVFIFIYIMFSAVSLNYAKAFRLKNSVIDYLEKNEILDIKNIDCEGQLSQIITNKQYNKTCKNGNGLVSNNDVSTSYCCNGVIITKDTTKSNNNINYYQVKTYADWNLGSLNMLLALGGKDQNSEEPVYGTWMISGEAKIIKRK